MPGLPANNVCAKGLQTIVQPPDGYQLPTDRQTIELYGDAGGPNFGKYQIDLTFPDSTFHNKEQFFGTVQDGVLFKWHFEPEQDTAGGGWYIIRLLVIDSSGSFIAIGPGGQNGGCHIRVYLPPPN